MPFRFWNVHAEVSKCLLVAVCYWCVCARAQYSHQERSPVQTVILKLFPRVRALSVHCTLSVNMDSKQKWRKNMSANKQVLQHTDCGVNETLDIHKLDFRMNNISNQLYWSRWRTEYANIWSCMVFCADLIFILAWSGAYEVAQHAMFNWGV